MSSTNKIISTKVMLIYANPSEIWGTLSTKTWNTLKSTYWLEWCKAGIARMKMDVRKTNVGIITMVSLIERNIGRIIIGLNNITSQTKKSINRMIESVTGGFNNVTKTLHRKTISNTKIHVISFKGLFQSMLTYITADVYKQLTFFKIINGLVQTLNTFIYRFGKAVVQEIVAIAVHAFVHEISVTREVSIQMSAVHKVKQEVIWRMGANSRGETLHMVLNETKVIELTVVNEDGTPTDLDGAWARFAVGGAIEKECGIQGNKITVMIEPDDIENTGTYDYEFRLKDIFDRVDSLIMGKVIVEPKVVSAY